MHPKTETDTRILRGWRPAGRANIFYLAFQERWGQVERGRTHQGRMTGQAGGWQRDPSHPLARTAGDTLMGLQVALLGLAVRQPRSEWQLLCLIEKRLWASALISWHLECAMGIDCPTSTVVGRVNGAGTWQAIVQMPLFTPFVKEKNVRVSHLPQSQL